MPQNFFRRACSDCGAPVEWLDAQAIREDAELSKLVREAAAYVGEPIRSVWRCSKACGGVGFFGALHMAG